MHPKYHETVERLKRWCQRESAVHSALILGSQVREEFAGDEWSDLDILLLVDNPQVFLQTDTWLTLFGDIVCSMVETTDLDWLHLAWTVKRVLYTDSRTVDFSIMPFDRMDDVLSLNAEIHANGYQIIYDDCPGLLVSKIKATLVCVKDTLPNPPSEPQLRQTIHELLFQLVFACKKIKRHELWVAVSFINHQISHLLLALIEFDAVSSAARPYRIRYDGRFLEQRIRPDVLETLPTCFARYDADDAIQATYRVLETAQQLTKDICATNGYPFSEYPFDRVRELCREMLEKRSLE